MLENRVLLAGKLKDNFKFYYSSNDRSYYINHVIVEREQREEHIPIVAEKGKIDFLIQYKNERVEIFGNLKETNFNVKFLFVKVQRINFINIRKTMDKVFLVGEMHKIQSYKECKDEIRSEFRISTDGGRITCMARNREAEYVRKIKKGERIKITGRIITENSNKFEVTNVRPI